MRNVEAWVQSKFERDARGRWRASRREVPITSRLMVDIIAAAYAEAIATHARGRLADLGCGKAPLYGMYRDKASAIVCVDWPSSLHGAQHVDTFADLNAPLALETDSYDTIVATDVIEHLHTPEALFSSAARALRSGGKLIVGVPFLYWVHEAPHDFHRYTRFALEKFVKDAGLAVVSLAPFAGAPEVISDIATKALSGRRRLARIAYEMTRALLLLRAVKRLSASTCETMPMGYILVAQKP
ncbi:MAG TPA: methyltransferase domain-containing protein [Stellaceae bacterium]|nr:methyltransferase domain-containing protein [Stellaceae bacterium]